MLETDSPFALANAHELLRRGQGGDPCDPSNIILLCWRCHMDLHPQVGGRTKRIDGLKAADKRDPLRFFERHHEKWIEVRAHEIQ
jgi:hypothetical protein